MINFYSLRSNDRYEFKSKKQIHTIFIATVDGKKLSL